MYYKKVLIAVDGSEMSRMVFKKGMEIVKLRGAEAMIVAVVDSTATYGFPLDPEEQNAVFASAQVEIMKRQEGMLKDFIEGLEKETGHVFEYRILYGTPHKEIKACAEEWDVDLLVVGSYGRGGWISDLIFGSTAEKLLKTSKCDVLVIKFKGDE